MNNIQSLSIVVPSKGCINSCKFCVSRMRKDDYENTIYHNLHEYEKRLMFARDNGCNTVMLTGTSEPQQNFDFLRLFFYINSKLDKPFRNIEMQTTGVCMTCAEITELAKLGLTTISLSVSCMNDDGLNAHVINNGHNTVNLRNLCECIKKNGINLRLSLNMTDCLFLNSQMHFSKFPDIEAIFNRSKELGADQLTFRKMYLSGDDTEQDKWLMEHSIDTDDWFKTLNDFILSNGTYIDTLEYGSKRYSVNGMSVVVDDDCMSKDETKQNIKYLILRPNCKLYTKWDDKGSLLF